MADSEEPQKEMASEDIESNKTAENGAAKQDGGPEPEKIEISAPPTFKTPTFVIPSKKKIQSDSEVSDVFKLPEKRSEKSKPQENEKKEAAPKEIDEKVNKADKPPSKVPSLSPAEQLRQAKSAVPYKEPPWGSLCEQKYCFEVIKNGAVIDKVDLATKSFHVLGRLPSCDIPMEHPSLSRYHAVLQYSGGSSEDQPQGWYLYDLDSTHGTWINKHRVPPAKYHRLHVDYVLKFGGSTRLFILQGPDDDRVEESELSLAEMKEQREKQLKEAELIRQAELDEAERTAELIKRKEDEKGCSWGIDEDAEEDAEEEENPFAKLAAENEQLYIDDPKKSLNGYFEREGHDPPEYEFSETGYGKWKCTVELPVDSPSGEPMRAEVVVSGKKKEAVIACALEACRVLDRMGELRKSTHESRKRKQRNWEEDDFYDSDEDVYLDRTGTIEKKREYRKMKTGKTDKASDTYDSLLERHKAIVTEIEEVEEKLAQAKAQAASLESDDIDALDAYMSAIKSGMMDTKTKMKLKRQLIELKQEEQKLRKLVNIAKPASLPELVKKSAPEKQAQAKPSILPAVGKMKGPAGHKTVLKKPLPAVDKKQTLATEEEEEEEEQEEENGNERIENTETVATGVSDLKESKSVVKSSVKDEKECLSSKEKTSTKSVTDTGKRMKGPSLPLAAVLQQLQSQGEAMESEQSDAIEDNADDVGNSSGKRKRTFKAPGSKKVKPGTGSYDSSDPDFATWLPPDTQSGDGKTHLNDKFGY